MNVKLTLQEKLGDLRDERKEKLQDVADATGIPLSTLSRIESSEDENLIVNYKNIVALADHFGVSTDYLCGVTENRKHRNVEIDALSLSDSAVEVLKSKNLNNRLISELLSHPDFQQLLNAIEVYIDKKMLPQMNTMNAIYRLAETTIKENYTIEDRGAVIDFLQNSVIDEDEYLRFRISERFNIILKSLFDAHRKDTLSPEYTEAMKDMEGLVKSYLTNRQTESEGKAKIILLCKQLGLNVSKLDDEEMRVLVKVLERSPLAKRGGRRK